MIEARRLTRWDGRYNLVEDGRCVATWERSHWATGGRFDLEGDAAADLPGLPRVVEVFAIAMALTRWESDAAATG